MSALALLLSAVLIGWAIVTWLPPPIASVGPSSTPELSPSVEPSVEPTEAATATPSPDGTPVPATGWTPIEIAGIDSLNSIAEHNGRLLAAGHAADPLVGAMATSDDGETWTPVDLPPPEPGTAFFSVAASEAGFVSMVARYPVLMGMAEVSYLYSDDGRTWHAAAPPAECFSGRIEAYKEGFIGLGGECRGEGDFRPSPLHVITSSDGRSWSLQISDQVLADDWATDGDRLVLFQHDRTGQAPAEVWISDDAAQTWRNVADAFPAGVLASGPLTDTGGTAPASRCARGGPDRRSRVGRRRELGLPAHPTAYRRAGWPSLSGARDRGHADGLYVAG